MSYRSTTPNALHGLPLKLCSPGTSCHHGSTQVMPFLERLHWEPMHWPVPGPVLGSVPAPVLPPWNGMGCGGMVAVPPWNETKTTLVLDELVHHTADADGGASSVVWGRRWCFLAAKTFVDKQRSTINGCATREILWTLGRWRVMLCYAQFCCHC